MNRNDKHLNDKKLEMSLHTLELINENIRLYHDNIKLNSEIKRLRKQIMEQEDVDRTKFEMQRLKDDSDPVVVLVLKKGREFIN